VQPERGDRGLVRPLGHPRWGRMAAFARSGERRCRRRSTIGTSNGSGCAGRELVRVHGPVSAETDEMVKRLEQLLAALERTDVRSCRRCGGHFEFSPSQAASFEARGWLPPNLCPPCRAQRQQERAAVEGTRRARP
jgi:hypothetical protein